MVNTLFLEDGDLLENVMISNQIHESEIMEFDRLISEQEMMISIYENQQFLIEQDTQIFMHLRYNTEVLSEGVLENIGKGIMAVLRKIGELISNFIGFITGRRKDKDNEKTTKDEEKISDQIDSNTKKGYATMNEVQDAFDNFSKHLDQMTDKDWKDEYIKNIESLKNTINECESGNKYIPIHIHKDVMRTINISNKWTEIEDLIKTAEEMIELAKEKKPIDDQLEKYKNFIPLSGNIRSSSNKNDNKSIFADHENKCNRKTYYSNYYKDAKAFFRNYTEESHKNITYLQDLLNKRIKPLEREVKNIISNTAKNDNYKKTINKLQTIINGLSQSCVSRIYSLTEIEKVYQVYRKNALTTYRLMNQIERANKDIEKYQKSLEKLNK